MFNIFPSIEQTKFHAVRQADCLKRHAVYYMYRWEWLQLFEYKATLHTPRSHINVYFFVPYYHRTWRKLSLLDDRQNAVGLTEHIRTDYKTWDNLQKFKTPDEAQF